MYHPEELSKSPFQVFKVWEGLSSFGGLLGALIAAAIFFRARRLRFGDYADTFGLSVPWGWAVARLGCFAVHDHPGVPTDFFLAVDFPGGARHDLGLYEFLYTVAVLVPAVVWLDRRERPQGTALAVLALLYAPARFLGDFLRNTDLPGQDPRFFGLTVAQYACIALLGLALALAMRLRRARPS
jgi:phosphatidylglycerol:prolipoprotein diacylglycerol transferase